MTTAQAKDPTGQSWRVLTIALGVTYVWMLFWYWPTLSNMAAIWWRSDTYQHGLVVPPIVAWLIWRKRELLAQQSPKPVGWIAIPVALVVFAWLLGELTAVNALTQLSVVALIVLVALSLLGLRIGKTLAFPLLFLFFAVPIGDFLMPRLMDWTADFTVMALQFTGIPVYREGLQFVIPSGNWSVVEACSGIRYLIASLTVGALFAYLNYHSLKRRLIFLAVAVAVPIVANWLRAYLIVLLGHVSGNKLAAGADHLIYGWVFFGIVIAIMFAIGMRWSEPDPPIEIRNETQNGDATPNRTPSIVGTTILITILLMAGPLGFKKLSGTAGDDTVLLNWPIMLSGSDFNSEPFSSWVPAFAGASVAHQGSYTAAGHTIGLYVAYYRNQNYDRKMVSSTNLLVHYKSDIWQEVNRRTAEVQLPSGAMRMRQAELIAKHEGARQRLNVSYWYWINGKTTIRDSEAKLLTAASILTGHGDDSAVVIVYANADTPPNIIQQFIETHSPTIHQQLAQAAKTSQ